MRLFVALNFPERIRQALWQATAPLRDLGLPVKWVRSDEFSQYPFPPADQATMDQLLGFR